MLCLFEIKFQTLTGSPCIWQKPQAFLEAAKLCIHYITAPVKFHAQYVERSFNPSAN